MSDYLEDIRIHNMKKRLKEEYNYDKIMDDVILNNCRQSIQYFAENFIKIDHVKVGKRTIKLNKTQERFLKLYEKGENFCVYSDRQKGKTTLALIILLHSAIFSEGSNFFIPCRDSQIPYISDTLFKMYEDLPDFLKEVSPLLGHLRGTHKNSFEFKKHSGVSTIQITGIDRYAFEGKQMIRNVYFDEIEYARCLEITRSQISKIMEDNASIFSFSSSNAQLFFGDKIYV